MAVALVSSAVLLVGLGQGSARADVSAITGSAYGYSCAVRAFGIACSQASPTPKVALAADASNSPQAATVPSGNAFTGPATVFSSGRIDVRTQGTLGAGGSVTSSTSIANVNASGNESLTAASLASGCTASEAGGATGSTTITGGTLQIDNGDSDPTNTIPDHAAVEVPLPANPAPNTSYDGHVHIGPTTDTFTYVFNEQVVGADGSITVNAVHEYLRGPAAVGEAIIGQSVCGVNTAGGGTPPPPPATTMDRAAPAAKLAGSRSQKLGKTVAVIISCADEACLATAGGTVPVPQVKAARPSRPRAASAAKAKVYKLKKVTRPISKGGSVTLKLKLSKAARTAIKRTLRTGKGKAITVKLRVTVADIAGNTRTLTRQVKLKL